jgi:hypothetical protein
MFTLEKVGPLLKWDVKLQAVKKSTLHTNFKQGREGTGERRSAKRRRDSEKQSF